MKIILTLPLLVLALAATDSQALSLEIHRRGIAPTEVTQKNQDSSEDSQCDSEDGKIICPE